MDGLRKFELYLILKGRRQSTIRQKLTVCKVLLARVKEINQDNLESFFLTLRGEGKKLSYINNYIDVAQQYLEANHLPKLSLTRFREDETFKNTLTKEQIKQILELPPIKTDPKALECYQKFTIFLMICAYCGMRPGEVATLTQDSVDFGRRLFVLRQTKTTPRLVPIPEKVFAVLTKEFPRLFTDNLLFHKLGDKTKPIQNVDWCYNFNSRLQRLGLKKEGVSIYSLRYSFITRMLSEDINLFKVQRIVGHKDAKTTAHYSRFVTSDLQKAIMKDPLAREGISVQERVGIFLETIKNMKLDQDKRFKFVLNEKTNEVTFHLKW